MTQTVPATAQLGPGKTGLAIGYRVLDIARVQYSAFTTTNVAETGTAGTYSVAGGVVAPNAGGYIVWGVSGTDYAEATVDSTSANVTYSAGVALTGRLAQASDLAALGNAGLYSYSATVDDGANPLDGVFVQCATDAGFTNVIATTYSNASGAYTVRSDQAGTHYLRFHLAGWNFSDETVTLV